MPCGQGHDLELRGVCFKVLSRHGASIGKTKSAGKLVSGLFVHSQEFQRSLSLSAENAGMASARARGMTVGASYKMAVPKLRLAMAAMGHQETQVGDLCYELGIIRQTLCHT